MSSLPPSSGLPTEVVDLLSRVRTIAVVGASDDPTKAAHRIPRRLCELGFRVFPVNPRGGRILGLETYTSLDALAAAGVGPIDLVDVFRPSAECAVVAVAAARIGARALWLQQDIRSPEAAATAAAAGMAYVEDRCLGVDAAIVSRAGLTFGGGPPPS